jgi:hypothetical protein
MPGRSGFTATLKIQNRNFTGKERSIFSKKNPRSFFRKLNIFKICQKGHQFKFHGNSLFGNLDFMPPHLQLNTPPLVYIHMDLLAID